MKLKILSYNIWDLPLWFVKDRKTRIEAVAHFLADSGADIICVQESWEIKTRNMLYEIMAQAGYEHASANEHPFLIGNGGLVTFSKFPIRRKAFMSFTRLSSAFVELFTQKGVLETLIDTPLGEVTVFNVHLHQPSWFLGRAVRLFQLRRTKKFFSDNKKVPSFLIGDFNENEIWKDTEFMSLLDSAGFRQPLPFSEKVPLSYRKENPFVSTWFNERYADMRFDYMFVREIEKISLQVISYTPLYLKPDLSDHDPVELILEQK